MANLLSPQEIANMIGSWVSLAKTTSTNLIKLI